MWSVNDYTGIDFHLNVRNTDTIQLGDHYLDNQFAIIGHLGDQNEFFIRPSFGKIFFYPKLYYQSNFISKKLWGGEIGTGMTIGLNYLLPYAAFSPEWRINNYYIKTDLGMQLGIGWNIGFIPFGGITGGYNYHFSKKFAIKAEVGAQNFIIPGDHYSIYPYLNLGLVYRRGRVQ